MAAKQAEQVQKAVSACKEMAETLRKHPEFLEYSSEKDIEVNSRPQYTRVTAHIGFNKNGNGIFQNPKQQQDHDWPEPVGTNVLQQAAKDAAKTVKLRLTANTGIFIRPSEKGWVQVGYEFLHPR